MSRILDEIEERIKPHVQALWRAGWATHGSCGHDMYVMVDCKLEDVHRLRDNVIKLGYTDFEISYTLYVNYGPFVKVKFGGELAGDGRPFSFVLLRLANDPKTHFVVRARDYGYCKNETAEERASHEAYFYDEHTCPTNWTRDIVAVIADGDADPHGFAQFVRRVPAPDGVDEDGCDADGQEAWRELFPELFTPRPPEEDAA